MIPKHKIIKVKKAQEPFTIEEGKYNQFKRQTSEPVSAQEMQTTSSSSQNYDKTGSNTGQGTPQGAREFADKI